MPEQNKIPKLYETDSTPFDEKVIVQVWVHPKVNFLWCVAEFSMQTGEAFGYANLNNDDAAEWGYFNVQDIKGNGAELTETTMKLFKEIMPLVRPKNGCPKCTSAQYGYQTIQRQDPTLVDDTFHLWICRNCNFQPFTSIRGLI
jgi:hypothetical protein